MTTFNALRENTNVSNNKGERFKNCFIIRFLLWTFSSQALKKIAHPSENATSHPTIMKTIRPSKVALLGPKGGLCGEIQRNQIFLIVIFPFNLIQIPVQFALKIWGKSQ